MVPNAKLISRLALCIALAMGGLGVVWAQDGSSSGQSAPDNTKTNAHRRANSEPTADQQKENASDRAISQQIRKAIVKDKSLSSYANNIKIITQNGQVTLAGPVRSEEERKALENTAAEVAGVSNVKNQLQVAPKQ
ncbi:MAG: BON domain-containing protein [Terriglobales bacterium]